jgi:hypothetical protein
MPSHLYFIYLLIIDIFGRDQRLNLHVMSWKNSYPIFLLIILPFGGIIAQDAVFSRVYFDDQGSVQGYGMIRTFDHNFMIAGTKNYTPLVMKIDSAGNVLWTRTVGTAGKFSSIDATRDSNYVLAGMMENPANSAMDILCTKINSDGDTLWTRTIPTGSPFLGGTYSIVGTSSNGALLAGSPSYPPFNKIQVCNLNGSGYTNWKMSVFLGNFYNCANSVAELPDGSFIMTGYLQDSSKNNTDMFLMKFGPAGNISWVKKEAGIPGSFSYGYSLCVVPDGIVTYVYNNNYRIVIMKTDFSGLVKWAKLYDGGPSSGIDFTMPKIRQVSDKGFIFFISPAFLQGLIIKTDSTGNALWRQSLELKPIDVAETDAHDLVIFGNGPMGGYTPGWTYNPQIGIIRSDSLGNGLYCTFPYTVSSLDCSVNLVPLAWTVDTLASSVPSHPVLGSTTLTVEPGCVPVYPGVNDDQQDDVQVTIFPNPSAGIFYLSLKGLSPEDVTSIEVVNTLGLTIYHSSGTDALQSTVDIGQVSGGLYMVKIRTANRVYNQKLMVCH